jgi:hypothetical protein
VELGDVLFTAGSLISELNCMRRSYWSWPVLAWR